MKHGSRGIFLARSKSSVLTLLGGGGVGNCSEMSDILNAYCIIKLLRAIVFKSQTKSNYFGKGRKLKFARLLHIASP